MLFRVCFRDRECPKRTSEPCPALGGVYRAIINVWLSFSQGFVHVDPSIIQSTGKKGKWFLAVCVHHTESVPAFKLQKVQMCNFRRSGRLRLYCVKVKC